MKTTKSYLSSGREGWVQRPRLDEDWDILPSKYGMLSGPKSSQLFLLWQLWEWGVAEDHHRWGGEVLLCRTSLHDQVLWLSLHLRQPDQLQLRQPWHLHRRPLLPSLDRSVLWDETARGLHLQGILRREQGKAGCNQRGEMFGSRCRKCSKEPMPKLAIWIGLCNWIRMPAGPPHQWRLQLRIGANRRNIGKQLDQRMWFWKSEIHKERDGHSVEPMFSGGSRRLCLQHLHVQGKKLPSEGR